MQQRKLYLLAIDRHILKELKCPTTTCIEVSTGSYFINFPNISCEKGGPFACVYGHLITENFLFFAWQLRIPLHKRKEMLTKLHSPTYSIMFLLENIYSIFLSASFWYLQTVCCTSFSWSMGASCMEATCHMKITHTQQSLWKRHQTLFYYI